MAIVSITFTSVALTESTVIDLSARLATSAMLPDGLKLRPEGCLPPVMVAASLGGFAFMSMTWILSSGTCLSVSPSLITFIESATSATVPVGSMSRLTGGPTIEFLSGRLATIFGFIGSARSTISTESLPAGEITGLPASSHRTFSSLPTIMKGAARAGASPNARTAAAPTIPVTTWDRIVSSPVRRVRRARMADPCALRPVAQARFSSGGSGGPTLPPIR